MIRSLLSTVRVALDEGDIRVLIFTGAGNSFIAGADTGTLANPDKIEVLSYSYRGRDVFREIELLPIPTIKAFEMGIVSRVIKDDDLLQETLAFAHRMAKNSAYAISYAKKAIDKGLDLDITSGLELETGYMGMIFGSQDQMEGFAAMKEKRSPTFLGRVDTI